MANFNRHSIPDLLHGASASAAYEATMILVDSRVGSSFTSTNGRPFDILAALKERTNGNAESATLGSADFAFEGHGPNGEVYIGIERKTLGDALGSMRSNRYAGDQAKRMSICFDVSYLVVEGQYRPSSDGVLEHFAYNKDTKKWGYTPFTLAAKGPQSKQYWQYSELDKHIVSMESKKNIIMVRSGSPMETVWQIINRYQWWQKAWDSHQSCDPIKLQAQVMFQEVTLLRSIANQIPGVGWEKSKKVESYFGSVERMATALSSEWVEAGFGKTLAAKFYGLLRKDWRIK